LLVPDTAAAPTETGVGTDGDVRRGRQPSWELIPPSAQWCRTAPWLWATLALVYFAGGVWLSLGKSSIMSDALSRTAYGYYPLFSRDPHLAAIGFVWNPLPSLVQMPLLPLARLWPAVANQGLAATAQSAFFMSGAVVVLRGALCELRVDRRVGWVLTALFALHPEIAYFGMNGMSEASFLFFLVLGAWQLMRWTRTGATNPLAAAGLALGAAYIARYEAIAAGTAAMALVAAVSYTRTTGAAAHRRASAVGDVLVVGVPIVFSVTVWSVTSWLIVGTPLAQLTSANGNSAQTRLASGTISSVVDQSGGAFFYLVDQARLLEPFGLLIMLAALAVTWFRRDPALLGAGSVLAGAYAFSVAALFAGQTFGWLRFSIALVPLVTLAAGVLLGTAPVVDGEAAGAATPRAIPAWVGRRLADRMPRRSAGGRMVLASVVSLLLAATLPVTATGLFNSRLAREESYFLTAALMPQRATLKQREVLHRYEQDHSLASWLDAQRLPAGTVLLDAANGFDMVLSSHRPHQFAIPSDRDFRLLLGDPRAHHVRYFVTGLGTGAPPDAIRVAYPHIDRDRMFRLVRTERNAGDLPSWHVYAVR